MAELMANADARQSVRTSFFFWMTVAMAALVFGGFGLSYFLPMMSGELTSLPAVVHAHGFFYFSWMLLLVVQSALINQGNVALHRSLGMLGISIGTGLMIMGTIVTILFTQRAVAQSDATVYGLMYISQLAVIGFGILFILAIRNVRDSAAHKRYILMATTAFLIGGVNRFFDVLFGLGFEGNFVYLPRYLTVDLFIIALLFYDWRTLGKPHQATLIGGAVNVIPQLLHAPIVGSAAYVSLTHWLGSLA